MSWTVLYAYPKDDTPGCTKEACAFSEALPKFQKLGAQIVGVSPDRSHDAFIKKYSLPFQLLSDPHRYLLKAFGAWGIKKNYGKTYEGVIRSTFLLDPAGHVIHAWRGVKVEGHVEKVLAKLQELKAKADT